MLHPLTAPDFETGFEDTRAHWSQVRRIMLDGLVRFVNENFEADGPEAVASLAAIQRGLEQVAGMTDLVAFRDQFGNAWKTANGGGEEARVTCLATLTEKIYTLGA